MSCLPPTLKCGKASLRAHFGNAPRMALNEVAERCGIEDPSKHRTVVALCQAIKREGVLMTPQEKVEVITDIPEGEVQDFIAELIETPTKTPFPALNVIEDMEEDCKDQIATLKDELQQVSNLLEACQKAKELVAFSPPPPPPAAFIPSAPMPPAPPQAAPASGLFDAIRRGQDLTMTENIERKLTRDPLLMAIEQRPRLRHREPEQRQDAAPAASGLLGALGAAMSARRAAVHPEDDEDDEESSEWEGGGRARRRSSNKRKRSRKRSSGRKKRSRKRSSGRKKRSRRRSSGRKKRSRSRRRKL